MPSNLYLLVLPVNVLYVVIGIILFLSLHRAYKARARVNELRKMSMPMPPWNWFTGHLLILQRYMSKFPKDTFINVIISDVARELGNVDMFYLDLWPFLKPTLFICSPDPAFQAANKFNLPKPSMYRVMFEPINGGPNLLTMNGEQWKFWRSLFNPGFAPAYLMQQVPAIIDCVQTFTDRLRDLDGKVLPLQNFTTPLTMDVIMRVALDLELNCQRNEHPLVNSLLTMISWSKLGNPLARFNPVRTFVLRKHDKIMNRIIGGELQKRFEELHNSSQSATDVDSKRSKSVVTLTLSEYHKVNNNSKVESATLDKHFADFATYQLRLFLFAGHDTVTSVLVYIYHMLYKHPEVRYHMCQEHEAVFGPNASNASNILRANPLLLNQTPFTLAVIKETMRLFPPAGAMREGGPILVDRNGLKFPTDDCLVSNSHHTIHRNPNVWVRAEDFLPERWLVDASHELYPPPDAFRPFELGPRMCIGHNLSLIELKITLIMTVRTFRVEPAYEKWDELKGKGIAERALGKWWSGCEKVLTVDGDRAYQEEKGGAHPSEGYPCTVQVISQG
ncbi:putative cytochrome P450 [Aaosphaeria arxii CBS 175.79]|uniref:Putative cytochrome P450 n=1 Tax=Aaosphaeria arxii CBS 175.79 TaxID=1450172 RepID=A0A6A5XPR2_9PLEO|nr:putative cytochrome P450 [Aaosphaeria arxii CBS 175.79]KAF2014334.1 putative cytochrome P450 [Aaosphaeria arxii CBS 175.79]